MGTRVTLREADRVSKTVCRMTQSDANQSLSELALLMIFTATWLTLGGRLIKVISIEIYPCGNISIAYRLLSRV
jgi:hypothetical protein